MRYTLAAAALSVAVFAAGVRWGVLVAGGSDSYGYVSQAGLWRQGLPIVRQEIVAASPWPAAAETWAPLGYRPSPHDRLAIVPIYAPGLPLLMASFQAMAGFCGAFVVVPLCGALTVWLTFALGRRLFDPPAAALLAAALVAVSPVFLYQLINAMSDVPVAAFWTLTLVLAVAGRPLASGLAMAMAIAIRPNLAPLAAIPIVWLWRARRSQVAWFLLGTAPAIVGVAWLNGVLYESPLVSGYGTSGALYSPGHFLVNVRHYLGWILDVETPIVVAGAIYLIAPALFPAPRLPMARWILGATIAATLLSYLFYQPFDAWWYLRFLLPMWPAMALATAAGVEALAARARRAGYASAMVAIAALAAWHGVALAARRSVFDLARGERRYVDVARFVAAHTDRGAVVLSHQHSGSLRLYADRLTLRYDILDPAWLDRTIAQLDAIGRRPYAVLDASEVDRFRERYRAGSRLGALDWPAMAVLGTGSAAVVVYDLHAQAAGTTPTAIAATRSARGWCDPPQRWPPPFRIQ